MAGRRNEIPVPKSGLQWTAITVAVIGLTGVLVGALVTYLGSRQQDRIADRQISATSAEAARQFSRDHQYAAHRAFLRHLGVIERAELSLELDQGSAQHDAADVRKATNKALDAAAKDLVEIELVSRDPRPATDLLVAARELNDRIEATANNGSTSGLRATRIVYDDHRDSYVSSTRDELGTGDRVYAARSLTSNAMFFLGFLLLVMGSLALLVLGQRRRRE